MWEVTGAAYAPPEVSLTGEYLESVSHYVATKGKHVDNRMNVVAQLSLWQEGPPGRTKATYLLQNYWRSVTLRWTGPGERLLYVHAERNWQAWVDVSPRTGTPHPVAGGTITVVGNEILCNHEDNFVKEFPPTPSYPWSDQEDWHKNFGGDPGADEVTLYARLGLCCNIDLKNTPMNPSAWSGINQENHAHDNTLAAEVSLAWANTPFPPED